MCRGLIALRSVWRSLPSSFPRALIDRATNTAATVATAVRAESFSIGLVNPDRSQFLKRVAITIRYLLGRLLVRSSCLCFREVRATLLNKRCERFLCFRRAHSRSELFVLDFYRLRDLLTLRMLHQSLASLQSARRFRRQLFSCFGRGGQQFFVGHNTGD